MEWKQGCLLLVAYLVGSFPTGVVLSRRRYGIDVREMGSGNIGATNITRNFGWKAGVATFLVDFMKGYLVVAAAHAYSIGFPWTVTLAGTLVVLGHCYSMFLKGRGGKGVATSLGCLCQALPDAGAIMATAYIVLLAITRVSALGSLVGISLATLYVAIVYPFGPLPALVYSLALIIIVRHQSNLRRLIAKLFAR